MGPVFFRGPSSDIVVIGYNEIRAPRSGLRLVTSLGYIRFDPKRPKQIATECLSS